MVAFFFYRCTGCRYPLGHVAMSTQVCIYSTIYPQYVLRVLVLVLVSHCLHRCACDNSTYIVPFFLYSLMCATNIDHDIYTPIRRPPDLSSLQAALPSAHACPKKVEEVLPRLGSVRAPPALT